MGSGGGARSDILNGASGGKPRLSKKKSSGGAAKQSLGPLWSSVSTKAPAGAAKASSTVASARSLLPPAATAPSLEAIQAGRVSLDRKWDEFQNAFAEMQRLAATKFLGPKGTAAVREQLTRAKIGPQSHAASVAVADPNPIVEGGREAGGPLLAAEAARMWRNQPEDEQCPQRAAKHPKASTEGGSAMGEWKDVVAGLRKQQRMGEDATDQLRPARAIRGPRLPVSEQKPTGRSRGSTSVSAAAAAAAADPKPALAYPGAFARMSFEERCECCRLATTAEISRDFAPLPKTKPGDWLSTQEEKGQTVKNFMSRTRAVNAKPGPARMTLYVQPLGSIDLDKIVVSKTLEERQSRIRKLEAQKSLENIGLMLPGSRFLQLLESFLQAFYLGMKVKVLPYKQIDTKTVDSRGGKNDWQLNASDLLHKALPRFSGQARAHDGFAFVGVTVEDLYPRDDWNFVFGLADTLSRTGVFSFARYADEGLGSAKVGEARLLKRAVKVMAHEIGHTFGLMHCIHFSCLMQGSMSAAESDTKPHEFCPLCLRKLFSQLEFDPLLRYEALIKWIEALDGDADLFAGDAEANEVVFGDWKAWYQRRIDAILGTGVTGGSDGGDQVSG